MVDSDRRNGIHSPLEGALRGIGRRIPALQEAYRKIRYHASKGEIRQFYHWATHGHFVASSRVRSFAKASGPQYLQVGGGFHLKQGPHWLNADLIAGDIYLDATRKLPFPNDSVDVIFTEQFFEHLPQRGGLHFLREAYRILKPGGIIRQSTPALEKLIAIYQDKAPSVSRDIVVKRHLTRHGRNGPEIAKNACQFFNDQLSLWGHQFVYDHTTLRSVTESVGFQAFTWCDFGSSKHAELRDLERHADFEWMKTDMSMFCEATKPHS